MSFNGSFLIIGGNKITGKGVIAAESYSCTRKIQDLDSYRDADGVLHRNALDNVPLKITFKTLPYRRNDIISSFVKQLQTGMDFKERKVKVTAYVPELDDYVTQEMYMADPDFEIDHIEGTVIYYKEIKFTFVGY